MKKLFCALLVTAFVCGCRPAVDLQAPEDYFDMTNPDGTRLSTIFEGFWNGMNTNYAFWDIDPTDWDAVYDEYMPKFEALGTLRDLTGDDVTLINGYFEKMLENIVDGHFRLEYTLGGQSQRIRPVFLRYVKQYGDDWQKSEIINEGSLDFSKTGVNKTFINTVENSIDNFCLFTRMIEETRFNVATGYITESIGGVNKDILYFHFSGFSWGNLFSSFYSAFPNGRNDDRYKAIDGALKQYPGSAQTVREVIDYKNYELNNDGTVKGNSDLDKLITHLDDGNTNWFELIYIRAAIDHFDYFFDQLAAKKNAATGRPVCGAVIDIRGNGGGLAQDLSTLWGRIVPADFVFAKKKFKSGENRLDYTPLVDFTIYKHPDNNYGGVTDIPLVLLVNKFSVSCAEVTTLFFRELPNGYVVGGETWGGMGVLHPAFSKSINAGQFIVGKPDPNGTGILSLVRTPGLQTLALNGKSYEGKGVPPDYPVSFSYDNMTGGTDDKLIKAIAVIQGNQEE